MYTNASSFVSNILNGNSMKIKIDFIGNYLYY